MYGELVPEGGGDTIPLLKEKLVIGRREECDIVLRFSNISSHHCELELASGYWFVKDLTSRNGTRVNGLRIQRKRLDPGDKLTIARHDYRVQYSPEELGASGPPPDEDVYDEIMARSLLESAGLNLQKKQTREGRIGRNAPDVVDEVTESAPPPPEEASEPEVDEAAAPEPETGDEET